MPQGDKYDFGKFLAEIVAKQIPVKFVSSVTVIFKNGKRSRLTKDELSTPLPIEGELTWGKVEEGFENVQNVEIHIDLTALGEHVITETDTLLDRHFDEDDEE